MADEPAAAAPSAAVSDRGANAAPALDGLGARPAPIRPTAASDPLEQLAEEMMSPRERWRQLGQYIREGRRMSYFVVTGLLMRVFPDKSPQEISEMTQQAFAVSDFRH